MSTSHHIYRRPFLSSWGVLALAFSDAARNVGRSTGADGHREDTHNREMLSAANPGWATQVIFTVNKQKQNKQIYLYLYICSYYLWYTLWWWFWGTKVSTRAVYIYRKRMIEVKRDEERRQKLHTHLVTVTHLLHLRDIMETPGQVLFSPLHMMP